MAVNTRSGLLASVLVGVIKYKAPVYAANARALRKHVHTIYRFFLSFKNTFTWKILIFFLIFSQNIDCGYILTVSLRRFGSNEYPQSMFWNENKKNRNTPAYPSFAI